MVTQKCVKMLGTILIIALGFPVSSLAQVTFEKTYGGEELDWAMSVDQTLDGGYILAGRSNSFSVGWDDVYLLRTDSLGNTLWDTTYGGSGDHEGYSVEQTMDEGYIVAGCAGCATGFSDVYLIKIDSLGDSLWARTYEGGSEDYGRSVQQTTDEGYIIAGFILPSWDIYLLKTDSLGNTVWDTTYSGSGLAFSVRQTLDDGYIVAGHTAGDVYLLKTDSVGGIVWDTTYGGSSDDYGWSVQQTMDGGYVIGGCKACWTDSGDAYVVKTDSVGNMLWERTYGGGRGYSGYSVEQTIDGGYIIAGCTDWSDPMDSADVYLVKTDSGGNVLWERTYGGIGFDEASCVRQTSDGGYIISGGTYSFGLDWSDVYLIKTDENGLVGIQEEDRKLKIEKRKSLQNQPNPFRRSTTISYCVPVAGGVRLEIFDISGRLVETLVDESQGAGDHLISWKPEGQPNGIYFYRFQTGGLTDTKKMTLLR